MFIDRARPPATVYHAKVPTVVVVPTYNESSNIRELVTRFFRYVDDVHLLVIDDDSPDGTAEICKTLQPSYPNLLLVQRKGQRGLGRAYLAAFDYALAKGFQIIGEMDADLSHDPAYVPRMLSLAESADVVIGSRYIRDGGTINWQIRRMLLSWLANKYAAKLLRIPAHDLTSGFRLYRRETLEQMQLNRVHSTGYSFQVEILYRAYMAGATVVECPIIFYDRSLGASKLARREIYMGAWHLLRLKWSKISALRPRTAQPR